MHCHTYLIFVLAICVTYVVSLKCVFQAKSKDVDLDVDKGEDTCESGDDYCVKLEIDGIYAKACSRTSAKMAELYLPSITCMQEGCDNVRGVCCCKGNKCNGAMGASTLMSLSSLAMVNLFLKS